MLTQDDTREIERNARLDERDEIVSYLRTMSAHMMATIKEHPWWQRWGVMSGAAALNMAAQLIGQRHRKSDAP